MMKTRVLAYTLFMFLICIAEQFYYLEWPFTKMLSASSMPSDMHYKLQPKIDCDTRIVLINTEKDGYQKIAELVHLISPFQPSVIGIHQYISASEADSIVGGTESPIVILAKEGLKVNG